MPSNPQPPRILHAISALAYSGPSLNLLGALNGHGPREGEHIVFVFKDAAPDLRRRLEQELRVECVILGQPSLLRSWLFIRRLFGLIRRFSPTVIEVSQCGVAEWALRLAVAAIPKRRRPVVVSLIQTRGEMYYTTRHGAWAWRLVRAGEALTRPWVDWFVVNSEDLLRYTVETERAPAHKVLLIKNGIDLSRFVWTPELARGGRTKLGLGPDDIVIGCVGSFTPAKDHLTLVRAFRLIVNEFPNARLLLVGLPEGRYFARVSREIENLGIRRAVVFAGACLDVRPAVAAMDIFVLASVVEGSPTALIEAMAMGRACVATQIPGSRELIRNRETGLLVSPSDASGLAAAIRTLILDPDLRERYGASAKLHVHAQHSLEKRRRSFAALYRKISAGLPPPSEVRA